MSPLSFVNEHLRRDSRPGIANTMGIWLSTDTLRVLSSSGTVVLSRKQLMKAFSRRSYSELLLLFFHLSTICAQSIFTKLVVLDTIHFVFHVKVATLYFILVLFLPYGIHFVVL